MADARDRALAERLLAGGLPPPAPEAFRFGPYQVEAELGRGGMAVVSRARHLGLDRAVALKILKAPGASAELVERFHREALAVAQLRHPNIVTVYDAGQIDAVPFIAMELVAGGSLTFLLERGRLSLRDKVGLLAKVADGVEHAHQKGIVHRGLKPANILVDPSGEPKIADFGIAHLSGAASLTRTDQLVGSPAYMSPEQVRGDRRTVGAASDLWSLGVIFYQMLTGRLPFDGLTVREVLVAILESEPRTPRTQVATAPPDLEAICLKLLEKDPRRRYATARQLAGDLRRFLKGEPVLARRPSTLRRFRRYLGPRRTRFAVAGTALLGALLAVVVLVPRLRAKTGEAEIARAMLEEAGFYHSIERELDLLRMKFYRPEFRLTEDEFARYDELVRQVRALMVRRGESAPGWYVIGRCREVVADSGGAEQAYERAISLDANHAPSLIRKGRLGIERVLMQRVSGVGKEESRPLLAEAEDAVRYVHMGVERSGSAWGMETDLAEAYLEVIRHWKSKAYSCEKMLAKWKGEPFAEEFLLLEGVSLGAGDLRRLATEVIERVPSWASAYAFRGAGYGETMLEAAIADYTRAIELNPRFTHAHNNRGVARQDKGDLDGAVADFDRAIEIDPRFTYAYNNRGVARRDKGDLGGAIADYTRAIELNPRFTYAYNNRGIARRDKGDLAGAIADFDRAIEIDPRDVAAYVKRGNARRDKGDLDGAVADFDRAIEIDPRDVAAYVNRGNARQDKGDLDGAVADFDRAIEIDARSGAAYYNRADARLENGDLGGAIADYTRAIELNPRFTHAYNNRGIVRKNSGDLDGALADFDRAIEIDPRDAWAYTNRGSARVGMGDLDGARADYRKALELAPADWPNRAQVEEALLRLDR